MVDKLRGKHPDASRCPEFVPVTLSKRGERMLEEALEDVRAGKVRKHDSVDSLVRDLHDEAHED